MSNFRTSLQALARTLVAYQMVLSIGVAAASSVVLHTLWPWSGSNSLLEYFALERPLLYWSEVG